jgi:molecular chaperone GrpE
MSKREKDQEQKAAQAASEHAESAEVPEDIVPEEPAAGTQDPLPEELEHLKASLSAKEEQYLRLAAEYDNFRKRSQKEKESIYADAKADALTAFLPVYDNLERALSRRPPTRPSKRRGDDHDSAREILTKLGISEIPALGESFDPNLHNAVMHVEDEAAGENTIVDVFQAGFKLGDKVIRFAMVKVAN